MLKELECSLVEITLPNIYKTNHDIRGKNRKKND